MNANEYDSLMARIESAYGQKVSADARMFIWPLCEKIPSRFLGPIAERLTDLDERPRNLKRAIRTIWHTLDSAAANSADHKGCAECVGGAIYVRRGEQTFAFQCAACHPDGEHKATRAQLRQAGFVIDNPTCSGRLPNQGEAEAMNRRVQDRLGFPANLAAPEGKRDDLDPREAARRAEFEDHNGAA